MDGSFVIRGGVRGVGARGEGRSFDTRSEKETDSVEKTINSALR
jgi:hypothetical protein